MRRMQMLLALTALVAIAVSGCSSDSSNPVNPPTQEEDLTPPAVPMNLTVTVDDASLTLAWDANSEIDLAGYRIYRKINQEDDYSYLMEWPHTRYCDQVRMHGLFTYSYRVTAVDESGNESAFSTPIQQTVDNFLPEIESHTPGTEGPIDSHYQF